MTSTTLVVTACIALLVGQSLAGSKFLATPTLNKEDLEADLLKELAGSSNARLGSIEDALRPMFAAMPKTSDGTLSHNVVQYVLQRYFSHHHGWLIRGIQPQKGDAQVLAQALNSSQVTKSNISKVYAELVSNDWAPTYLQEFLEKLVAGHGVSLRELAVLATTIEDLVHKEESNHLLQAYGALDQSENSTVQLQEANKILTTYMMIYMLAGAWTPSMANKVDYMMKVFRNKCSHWDETLIWLKNLVDEVAVASPGMAALGLDGVREKRLDFDGALGVTSKIGERFATFNNGECGRLKDDLLKTESAKPGRVRLVDFYKKGLQGAWDFKEKIDFLRDIGTLDESDPSTPLVIIPNYVQARTNCLVVSRFYSVCCPNECEAMMRSLEGEIVSSTARPAQIAKIVSQMSSATFNSSGQVSKPLMQRLHSIASHHGGEVPLHGRLFGQWMHHAFPRECPYPHAGGTTVSQTQDEWMAMTGQTNASLSNDEIQVEVAAETCRLLPKGVVCSHGANHAAEKGEDLELPWDASEELLVVHDAPPTHRVGSALTELKSLRPVHDLALFAALASMMYALCGASNWSLGRRLSLFFGVSLPSAAKPDKCFA